MTTTNEKKTAILVGARAHRDRLAKEEPSEAAQRREDQIRRVKARLRRFVLDHGIEVKDVGRALGYEAVGRLPRHLGRGKPDIEDLLAMTEYFEDLDVTAILRDVIFGVDEHPDEAQARREGTITPDGERIAVETPVVASAPSAPSPQEGDVEEVVIVQPDAVAPPQEDEEPSLDTDEGLRVWANRFGFSTGA
jgi:hypothetical protein